MNLYIVLLIVCFLLNHYAVPASPANQTNGVRWVEIPLTVRKEAAIIQIKINGKGPYNMAIATCFKHSTLAWSVKDETGSPLMYTIDPTEQKGNYARATNIQVGDINIDVLYMQLVDLSNLSKELDIPLHGLLGYDFLKGGVVQIDYKNEKVRLLPNNKSSKDWKKSDSQSMSFTSEMKLVDEGRKPVIDGVLINGVRFRAMIDTWQNLPLSLTPDAVKKLNLTAVNAKSPPRIASVDSLQIGPFTMNSPETAFYSKGTGFDYGLEKCGAIIGGGFLKKYSITFDYINNLVLFE
jgi:hypothetical protein